MAFLLLLSTVSWTVDKHLCMGRVMDVSFFLKADDCGMEAAIEVMENDGFENHCCDDETFTQQGQDDLKLSFNEFDFDQQIFLIAFTTSFATAFTDSPKNFICNEYYPPPIIVKDRIVLHEVFLI
jgi:hypothetical protein